MIGAGTAGSAAAIFLARAGHKVTVYERVPEPSAVGAGLVLQPSGLSVLGALGLVDEVVARGSPIRTLLCETAKRRKVVELSYELVSREFYGVGMHRGVLFQSLIAAVKREKNITLRCGIGVEDLASANPGEKDGKNFVVQIDTPGEIGSAPGKVRHGPHDLIIVADGSKSRLRDDTAVRKTVKPYPWGALWFIGKDVGAQFAGRLYQVVNGTHRLLGLLPTGLGPDPANLSALVTLFWSIRVSAIDAWRQAGLAPWKEEILSYAPAARPLLDQIERPEQVLVSTYFDVVMSPWNTGNVVYLGDAAHAMSPQLGQGCNLALMDAMVLAQCLEAEPEALASALDEYSRRRRAHLSFYQFATRWLTPLFQSDHGWLSPVRDLAMPLMCKVGWFHRQMVTSMCGVSLGPFSAPMQLSANPPSLPAAVK